MKQEVRIQLDISVTFDAKYSEEELQAIIERDVHSIWTRRDRQIHSLRYAEERHIYHGDSIQWQTILADQTSV